MKEVFYICSDKLDRETIELPKEITEHYVQITHMVKSVIEIAEKEFEILRKKKVVLRELTRLEKMTNIDMSKAKKLVIEQAQLSLEILRRRGVINEHLYGYLIQVIEIERNAFIGKIVLGYLRNLQRKVKETWSSEHEKIRDLMDEYNAILNTLKKKFKLLEIPCKEATYEIDFFSILLNQLLLGKQAEPVIDWYKTLKTLERRLDCLIDFIESIIEGIEEEEEKCY